MGSGTVETRVRYLNDSWKGTSEVLDISTGAQRRSLTSYHDVEIQDARPLRERDEIGLEKTGFTLVKHPTTVDFFDVEQIETGYYAEVSALLKSLTGADLAIPNDHLVRTELAAEQFAANYSRYLHLDHSAESGPALARELLAKHGHDDVLSAGRFDVATYNTWQPVQREVQQKPLTLIDASSLDEADLTDYRVEGYLGRLPFYRPEQRLYYFSRLRPDELLVFKQTDTRPGRTLGCPHQSFEDPDTAPDAPGRRSIEVRWVLVFGSRSA